MQRTLLFAAALFILLGGTVNAQGWYIGAGIGNSFYNAKFDFEQVGEQVKELDENATGYKFFAGLSTPGSFGVEGGYRNFGTIKGTESGVSWESQTTGWDVVGMYRFQLLMIVDVFGKAGALFWNTDSKVGSLGGGDSGTAFAWGFGAGVHIGPVGVRLEWENFEVKDPDNLSMLSLSATYGF